LGLAFFSLIIFGPATPGLLAGLTAIAVPTRAAKFAMAGSVLNGITLAIPILLVVVAVGRLFVSTGA
jgi:hypothetical protein